MAICYSDVKHELSSWMNFRTPSGLMVRFFGKKFENYKNLAARALHFRGKKKPSRIVTVVENWEEKIPSYETPTRLCTHRRHKSCISTPHILVHGAWLCNTYSTAMPTLTRWTTCRWKFVNWLLIIISINASPPPPSPPPHPVLRSSIVVVTFITTR